MLSPRSEVTVGLAIAGAAAAFAMANPEAAEAQNPCPAPTELAKRGIPQPCRDFLMRQLDIAGYDDPYPLNVATYQKVTEAGPVDGDVGPITARSILQGKGLNVAYPELKPQGGPKIAIDKSRQVSFLYSRTGRIHKIFSVSTGTEEPYKERVADGRIAEGDAHTPTGIFKIKSRHGPEYKSSKGLGEMPYARFFLPPAYAFHSGNVSFKGRGSHGCVRYNPSSMQYMRRYPVGTPVVIREGISTS